MKTKHCIPSTPIVGIGITVAAVVGAVERVVAEDLSSEWVDVCEQAGTYLLVLVGCTTRQPCCKVGRCRMEET